MANAQVAQFIAHKGLAYTVSGSVYSLTSTTVDSKVLADLIRAAKEWNFKVSVAAGVVTVRPV